MNNLLEHDKTLKAWSLHYPSVAEKKHNIEVTTTVRTNQLLWMKQQK